MCIPTITFGFSYVTIATLSRKAVFNPGDIRLRFSGLQDHSFEIKTKIRWHKKVYRGSIGGGPEKNDNSTPRLTPSYITPAHIAVFPLLTNSFLGRRDHLNRPTARGKDLRRKGKNVG